LAPGFIRIAATLPAPDQLLKFMQSQPCVHISDLTALYALLTEKILLKESIPSGEQGYYFAIAHKTHWWDVMERLAERLFARGLVDHPTAEVWSSDDVAAENLGFPRAYLRAMVSSRFVRSLTSATLDG
jgi:hypothetical protein